MLLDGQAEGSACLDPVDRLKTLQTYAAAHHVQPLAIGPEFG